jgi:hypothetical protein
VVLFRHTQYWQFNCNLDRIMKRSGILFLPFIASALLFAAGTDEPKVAPAVTDVDLANTQPAGKPACTAAVVGHQWPDEAADPQFAAALAPYGYPMVCTHTGSTYVWRSVNPRKEQPKKSDKPALPVAPALPRAVASKN